MWIYFTKLHIDDKNQKLYINDKFRNCKLETEFKIVQQFHVLDPIVIFLNNNRIFKVDRKI